MKTEENCGQVIEIFITRLKVCAPDKFLALYIGFKITPKVINPGLGFGAEEKEELISNDPRKFNEIISQLDGLYSKGEILSAIRNLSAFFPPLFTM